MLDLKPFPCYIIFCKKLLIWRWKILFTSKLVKFLEGEICLFANREFVLNKYKETKFCKLPTAAELRASLNASIGSDVRNQINMIFDVGTFVELGAYTKRTSSDFINTDKSGEFESVICGYGAIEGKLAFAFAEDATRMGGVIDDRHAKKIVDLYRLATDNGAAVIGIFNSNGADIFSGTSALSAYGKIMSAVAKASGTIPQIAFVTGKCIGTSAAIAAMFDIVVKDDSAELYVATPALTGIKNAQDSIIAYSAESAKCISYIRSIVSYLPDNSSVGIVTDMCTDNLNKKLGDLNFAGNAVSMISAIADNALFYEYSRAYAPEITVAFTSIGGVRCGVIATSYSVGDGRITASGARKASKFINFCNSFSLPLVTLVDSDGLAVDKDSESALFSSELAKLAFSYASATVPKVTVIVGHAIGAAFVLLGSKSLGADIVYAIDNSEIGALTAEASVAFAWDKYINEENTRDDLILDWKSNISSPVHAAESGDIDDIISTNELRLRLCSALLMLGAKGAASVSGRMVLPL